MLFWGHLLQEYSKTAEVMGGQPWDLLKARTYLEKLCLDNETGHAPPPAPGAQRHGSLPDEGHCPSGPDGEWRPQFSQEGCLWRPQGLRSSAGVPSEWPQQLQARGGPPKEAKHDKTKACRSTHHSRRR